MKLECIKGDYVVTWTGRASRGYEAKQWCNEQFEPGWGEVHVTGPGASGLAFWKFTFKRLYHAQWFMLRWSELG